MDDKQKRMATGMAGGIGGTHEEICGALNGGVMVIGALLGRIRPGEDDSRCMHLAAEYRKQFVCEFGATRCQTLRDSGYGAGTTPCSVLVGRAASILLTILTKE